MASTTITIPDAQVDRVTEAFGWPLAALPAETKGAFIKRNIIALVKSQVNSFELARLVAPTLDVT